MRAAVRPYLTRLSYLAAEDSNYLYGSIYFGLQGVSRRRV